jgi:hypothetical protein
MDMKHAAMIGRVLSREEPMLLRPTGRCFDDALEFLEHVISTVSRPVDPERAAEILDRFTVVHGICQQPIGSPYAHAWVEEGPDKIWQGAILEDQRVFFAVERKQFYTDREVLESTRYSWREAMKANWESNHYGPWEQKYLALCRAEGEPIEAGAVRGQRVVEVVSLERED